MKAKKLATLLSERCRDSFKPWPPRRKGERGIYVGGPYEHDDRTLGKTYRFSMREEFYEKGTIWSCFIHVNFKLEVFIEEREGKVPHDVAACVLESLGRL